MMQTTRAAVTSAAESSTLSQLRQVARADIAGRARVTVIVTRLENGRAFHFCNHPVLSGATANLWFPLAENEDTFSAIERVMTMNHVAANVTRAETVRESANTIDYDVIYNLPAPRG